MQVRRMQVNDNRTALWEDELTKEILAGLASMAATRCEDETGAPVRPNVGCRLRTVSCVRLQQFTDS